MHFGLNLPPQIRIYSAFFVYSFALGGIYPRLGDLQLAMGIGEGALGISLLGIGLGSLISLTFASPVLDRIGYRRTLMSGIMFLSIVMGLATLTSGPAVLFAVFLAAGLTIGCIEIVINVEADRIEHLVGRRIMNRAHAFWSFGFFAAGIAGAVAKQAGLSPHLHLFGVVPLIIIATFLALGRMTAAPARTIVAEESVPKFAAPTLGILALVAFTLSAMFLEGAGADWSVIMMRDSFTATPFINGLAFAVGALAQALVRFYADGFVDRFGAQNVARTLVVTLGAGTVLVVIGQHPMVALAGFALIGMGTSAAFPLAMSAAAQRTDRPAAINVAALAQLSFGAFLIGPPLLGFVAEHLGIRTSFAICLPFVVLSWFAVRSLAPADPRKLRGALE